MDSQAVSLADWLSGTEAATECPRLVIRRRKQAAPRQPERVRVLLLRVRVLSQRNYRAFVHPAASRDWHGLGP